MALAVGMTAPDFTLRSHTGEDVTLSDYKDKKHVILSFHVLTFTGG